MRASIYERRAARDGMMVSQILPSQILPGLVERLAVALLSLGAGLVLVGGASAGSEPAGVIDAPCPAGAIAVAPGAPIQEIVERAGEGAVFCLRNGIHRMQVIHPKRAQSFYGEGRTILNGSRLLTQFGRDGRYFVARIPDPLGTRHGTCDAKTPACDFPDGFFIDDVPLLRSGSREGVDADHFYVDRSDATIYFARDPVGHRVEAAVDAVAFDGSAPDVRISNVIVEKYASVAGRGAIQAKPAAGWILEHCELRLNSGGGAVMGPHSRVRDCNIHHNGQIGIGGLGPDILIENNHIWANNTHGFDFRWEAGGVKIVASTGVVFRRNHVDDNSGPGLWCDISCRDVVYEANLVEGNVDSGIFHEISFDAVIRDNIVRHNGSQHRHWFWGAEIMVAASERVEVSGNKVAVASGGCGIVLIDQGRRMVGGGEYKTQDDTVRDNDMRFEGAPCAGAASDTKSGDANFDIIAQGNNRFDGNVYQVPQGAPAGRFAWGRAVVDWDALRGLGEEAHGLLSTY